MARLKTKEEVVSVAEEKTNKETTVNVEEKANEETIVSVEESANKEATVNAEENVNKEIPDCVLQTLKIFSNYKELYVDSKGGAYEVTSKPITDSSAILYQNPYYKTNN